MATVFDCETILIPKHGVETHRANLITAAFEDRVHCTFSTVAFFEKGLKHPLDNKVLPAQFTYDYLPSFYDKNIPAKKLNRFYRGRSYERENCRKNEKNEPVTKPPFHTLQIDVNEDEMENDVVLRFLTFFLNSSFYNSNILSHFGSRVSSLRRCRK